MITLDQAMTLRTFYHATLRNADGTALLARRNGGTRRWKTRPDDFRVPVKCGLRQCFHITQNNADEWLPDDPTLSPPMAAQHRLANPHQCSFCGHDGDWDTKTEGPCPRCLDVKKHIAQACGFIPDIPLGMLRDFLVEKNWTGFLWLLEPLHE